MSQPVVLTASRLSPLYLAPLQATYQVLDRLHELDPAAFDAIAPQVVAIAASGESRVEANLIARLPALRIISVMGVGYDGVAVAAARERGIMVTHTPDVLNDEVADTALGLMLCARAAVVCGRSLCACRPVAARPHAAHAQDVGCPPGPGRHGPHRQGHRAARAGLRHVHRLHRPHRQPDLPYAFHADAAALAAVSDFLVVITPGGAGTRKLINAEVLSALGPKGILVNVARGPVVDEAALIAALQAGTLGGAALDVFENEPVVPQALLDMPQVVLSPHIGSATRETRQAMVDLAMANLAAHFAGTPLLTPVPECRV